MTELWYAISQLWVGTFFYGIYFTLFCICIYILLRRPSSLGNTVLIVTAIALFTLSTAQVVINLVLGAVNLHEIDIPFIQLHYAATIIYGINNMIADGLVYSEWTRCFLQTLFFALSLTTNILVTAMTAGRIWWIYRTARVYLQADVQRRYVSAMSILVESGVLYSATVLVFLILGAIPGTEILQSPIFQMLTQIMGIAPTLIIVRVGLGASMPSGEATAKAAACSQKHPVHTGHSQKNVPTLPRDVEKGSSQDGLSIPRPF
ncbi:hypothetical protein B0H14DRAFT_2653294 [Mycena olivaceomarginata]|nr:hypothetical protein B0H14DRAFT_2653294 [Mycena olivaceomarginata]